MPRPTSNRLKFDNAHAMAAKSVAAVASSTSLTAAEAFLSAGLKSWNPKA